MLTATLTMAPIYSLWLTSCDKPNRAAQAATFELISRAGHKFDPSQPTWPSSFAALRLVYILWRRIGITVTVCWIPRTATMIGGPGASGKLSPKPKVSVPERADFVLNTLGEQLHNRGKG
jgi:hypothetical protein